MNKTFRSEVCPLRKWILLSEVTLDVECTQQAVNDVLLLVYLATIEVKYCQLYIITINIITVHYDKIT